MATEAQVQAMIDAGVIFFEDLRDDAEGSGTNLVARIDAFGNALGVADPGDFMALASSAMSGARRQLAGVLTRGAVANVLTPLLLAYREVMDIPHVDPRLILEQLYLRFIDNTDRVTSRQWTRPAASAGGSNVGDGVINRLNTDSYAFSIQLGTAEAREAECIADQNTGTNRHEELFEFKGADSAIDALETKGSGLRATIAAVSARNSLLNNPSFSQVTQSGGAPTAIQDWASDVTVNGTNYAVNTTDTYRSFQGDSSDQSLEMKVAATLSQALSVKRTQLDKGLPYYTQVAWRRDSGSYTASGTLTLHCGTNTKAVAVSAQTGWQVLRLDLDENLWPRQFSEDQADIKVQWAPDSGSDPILVDDVIFVPMTRFDGVWYTIVGGATPFLIEDVFTWTDAVTEAVLQRWFVRAFNAYLPHTTGSGVTWADPT